MSRKPRRPPLPPEIKRVLDRLEDWRRRKRTPPGVPQALRFARGRTRLLSSILPLVQDALRGPPRHGPGDLRTPPADPPGSLQEKPRAVREKATEATVDAPGGLDQPAVVLSSGRGPDSVCGDSHARKVIS